MKKNVNDNKLPCVWSTPKDSFFQWAYSNFYSIEKKEFQVNLSINYHECRVNAFNAQTLKHLEDASAVLLHGALIELAVKGVAIKRPES